MHGEFVTNVQHHVNMTKVKPAVIDFAHLLANPEETSHEIIRQLETLGLFALVNVPQIDFESLHVYTRWFFYLPPHLKRKLSHPGNRPGESRVGYFLLKSAHNTTFFDEVYAIERECCISNKDETSPSSMSDSPSRAANSSWPDAPGREEFKTFMRQSFVSLQNISHVLYNLISFGMGWSETDLAQTMHSPQIRISCDSPAIVPRRQSLCNDNNNNDHPLSSVNYENPSDIYPKSTAAEDPLLFHDENNNWILHLLAPLGSSTLNGRWIEQADGTKCELDLPSNCLVVKAGSLLIDRSGSPILKNSEQNNASPSLQCLPEATSLNYDRPNQHHHKLKTVRRYLADNFLETYSLSFMI